MNTLLKNFLSTSSRCDYLNFMKNFDCSQTASLRDNLILVDRKDQPLKSISKIDAHLKISKNEFPHRAFSVFLFNKSNELLLQQRSSKKITFPFLWSNTCCSHPLDNKEEKNMKNNIGIKKAAVRRMEYELGMKTNVNNYYVYEKILYRADSDKIFEEFELDYVLLAEMDIQISELKHIVNKDEVADVKFYTKERIKHEVECGRIKITPWFKLILDFKFSDICKFMESFQKNQTCRNENPKIVSFI